MKVQAFRNFVEIEKRSDQELFWKRLQAGEARMGWSGRDDHDLRIIVRSPSVQLTSDQKAARRGRGFLERVQPGDLMFYPHVPDRELLSVVQITGEYNYLPAAQSIGDDFRSCRPCLLLTPEPLNMRTDISSDLRNDLGGRGRLYRLGDNDVLALSVTGFITDWNRRQKDLIRSFDELTTALHKIEPSGTTAHGGIGHNQSPFPLDESEYRITRRVVAELRNLAQAERPEVSEIQSRVHELETTARKIWNFFKHKADKATDEAIKLMVLGVGALGVAAVGGVDEVTKASVEVFHKLGVVVHAIELWVGTVATLPAI